MNPMTLWRLRANAGALGWSRARQDRVGLNRTSVRSVWHIRDDRVGKANYCRLDAPRHQKAYANSGIVGKVVGVDRCILGMASGNKKRLGHPEVGEAVTKS